jgi:hypothetical protein
MSGNGKAPVSPLLDEISRVMDELDGAGDVPGEPMTPEQAEALEKAERQAERRTRRTMQERARRAAQLADEQRLARAFASGRAVRPLLAASRYMSRRGLKVLRGLAQDGNLQALRMLCDLTRALAMLEFAVKERRGQGAPRPERVEVAWPKEGEKT